jgi:outer membrane protein assembly factor BamB
VAVARSLAFLPLALLAACSGHAPPRAVPLFPMQSAWRTLLPDQVVPPLAADSGRVFVSTRDGSITALAPGDGTVAWRVAGPGGPVTASNGSVVVRSETGAVWSLGPRDGALRWKAETGVAGTLPAVLDGDHVYVAGRGLVALDAESGRTLWTDPHGAEITSPPVPTVSRLVVGDADGVLRSLDRASGVTRWSRLTGKAVLAPPLVDEGKGRIYVGTTDRSILEVGLEKGEPGWRWKVGADIQSGGLLLPDRVVFAAFDAVLWALGRGGSLAWRAPLPSRPLGAPLLVRDSILLVCRERDLLGFSSASGLRTGGLRTTAEIRTPPLVVGSLVVLGLRDRSVEAYTLPEPSPAPALEPPATAPARGSAPPEEPPPDGPPVEDPGGAR